MIQLRVSQFNLVNYPVTSFCFGPSIFSDLFVFPPFLLQVPGHILQP